MRAVSLTIAVILLSALAAQAAETTSTPGTGEQSVTARLNRESLANTNKGPNLADDDTATTTDSTTTQGAVAGRRGAGRYQNAEAAAIARAEAAAGKGNAHAKVARLGGGGRHAIVGTAQPKARKAAAPPTRHRR